MMTVNLLSIDVEDYFQVSAFEKVSPPDTWASRELRAERNTDRVLELLERAGVRATFFILGWIAEHCPRVVHAVVAQGHEVASHGYWHRRVTTQTREEFGQDVRRAKALLEDVGGAEVLGYRAPSYSISRDNLWAFDELFEAGYRYDSSVFPVRHDFYGIPDWPRWPGAVVREAEGCWRPSDGPMGGRESLIEVPITTLSWAGKTVPIAGGGYFRLFPYWLTRYGLSRINQLERRPFVFYLHPWELDPGQPRMHGAGVKSRIRHYLNLRKTEGRFKQLLADFRFSPIAEGLKELHGGC